MTEATCIRANFMRAACSAAIAALIGACGAPNTTSAEAMATFSLTSRAGIDTYAVVPDQLRLASATIFRDFAVAAPHAPLAALRHGARDVLHAETGVHRTLGEKTQREILPYLVTLDRAARRGDRLQMAGAAREAVRLIAEDMSPAADKQAAFTLVDYAQLVIEAELSGSQTDWSKVNSAISLAAAELTTLDVQAGRAGGSGLGPPLAALASAVRRRDRDFVTVSLLRLRSRFDAYRQEVDTPIPDQALVSARV